MPSGGRQEQAPVLLRPQNRLLRLSVHPSLVTTHRPWGPSPAAYLTPIHQRMCSLLPYPHPLVVTWSPAHVARECSLAVFRPALLKRELVIRVGTILHLMPPRRDLRRFLLYTNSTSPLRPTGLLSLTPAELTLWRTGLSPRSPLMIHPPLPILR
jgi:hypothetical protein